LPDVLDAGHISRLKREVNELPLTAVDYSPHQKGSPGIQFRGGAITDLIVHSPTIGRARGVPAFFAHLDRRTASPVWNVTMVGVMAAAGEMVLNYERSAELINFGAFLAFMG